MYLAFKFNFGPGQVIFSIDRTIPPFGVALPFKFVLPAAMVRGIFAPRQYVRITEHSLSFIG